MAARTSITVSVPSEIISKPWALKPYIHRALREYCIVHDDTLTPEFRRALTDPGAVQEVRDTLKAPEDRDMGEVFAKVFDGNNPEDASGARSDGSGRPKWNEIMGLASEPTLEQKLTKLVIDGINHEMAHHRVNTSQSISKLRAEMENADDEIGDEVHALERQLKSWEGAMKTRGDEYRRLSNTVKVLTQALMEVPEAKAFLVNAMQEGGR